MNPANRQSLQSRDRYDNANCSGPSINCQSIARVLISEFPDNAMSEATPHPVFMISGVGLSLAFDIIGFDPKSSITSSESLYALSGYALHNHPFDLDQFCGYQNSLPHPKQSTTHTHWQRGPSYNALLK